MIVYFCLLTRRVFGSNSLLHVRIDYFFLLAASSVLRSLFRRWQLLVLLLPLQLHFFLVRWIFLATLVTVTKRHTFDIETLLEAALYAHLSQRFEKRLTKRSSNN